MEHFKILVWAALHSKRFSEIRFHSPLTFDYERCYGQLIITRMLICWEIESLINIPWGIQMSYHNWIVNTATKADIDFFQLAELPDDIPF